MRNLLSAGLVLLMLCACTVGPDYVRPDVDTPPAWRVDYQSAATAADIAWWERFNDTVLNGLIDAALRDNLDLLTAAARVDQYLGALATTRSEFFPQVGASATALRQRDSEDTAAFPPENPYSYYQGSLNVSWEIDLWGRIRRANEAARAEVLASEEGRRAVILTLVSSVANGYITLRGLDRQLEISRETERAYAETLRLFNLRHQHGTVSQVEVSQVQSQYETAAEVIPRLEAQVQQQENLLSLLLGHNPGPIPRGRTIDQLTAPDIPAGLPSTLLAQRPDILQAEQTLIAANARIGVARALYFPRISLTGLLGTASSQVDELLTNSSKTWSLGADALAPIFTFGAIAGQVQQAEAVQKQALYQYQQAILAAFREVEDALVGTTKGRVQLAAQRRQVAALSDYARLARLQYEAGTADYLKVLDADRSLFSGQLAAVQTQAGVFISLVNVYRAMGGGWLDIADRATGAQPAAGAGQGS